ncbi:MAG TPA: hypothetical protein VFI31_22410 [Pirellulales bacterium]|nr:hypothetical protein [Pirellulales bacterium]
MRTVWRVEDLICEWLRVVETANEIFAYYCEHAELPNSEATFSYFIDILEATIDCGIEIEDLVSILETQQYLVERGDELRRGIASLQGIVDEDRLATNMAFQGGALDEWN